jgi:hypothetical protein
MQISYKLVFGFISLVGILLLFNVLTPTHTTVAGEWVTPKNESKKCYVTLATTDNSVIGVLVLAYTLRETHSKYPLVVLVSHDVTEAYLSVFR